MGVHEGHRERLKASFAEHGLESFNDINALELLLFYAIPRKDTNPIAHALIDHFGNLDGVFNASIQQLTEIDGIGENTALLLKLVPAVFKKSYISRSNDITYVKSSADAGRLLVPHFLGEKDEVVWILCLDSKKSVLMCSEMGRGISNAVHISIRRIVEAALKCKANSVIIAHNHPNGIALPSREDDLFTKYLCDALEVLSIKLEDHLIVTGTDYISMADSGVMTLYRR